MASTMQQGDLFERDEIDPGETVGIAINDRCRIQTSNGYRVVTVCGLTLGHYAVGDRMGEAYAMVSLVDQGWAKQCEVATALGCDVRTVRRNQSRFGAGGLSALGRKVGYPKGAPRLSASRTKLISTWRAEGVPIRTMARRLGVNDKAVRKQLRRLGWSPEQAEQLSLELKPAAADPNLSGPPQGQCSVDPETPAGAAGDPLQTATESADPNLSGPPQGQRSVGTETPTGAAEAPLHAVTESADPNLSGSETSGRAPMPVSLDADATNRSVDRVLACLGMLDDAAPLFADTVRLPGAGVLFALPALVDSGVLEVADQVYGSLGPAFYGLRTTIMTLLVMALLRIKRPEGLKEHSPRVLGCMLGLDRAPEVKTLRKKLARLASYGCATEFGRVLAERRVSTRGYAMGFLYVDGHVRAYHGKRQLPKTHLARMRLAMPATTDYWVNDAEGEPLFVVTTEANQGLVKMLPIVLDEVRSLVGDRRVTVVFDRGGWSPKLFQELLVGGFDILTYRKGRCSLLSTSSFCTYQAEIDGHNVSYCLADTGTYLGYGPPRARKRLHLRQVTRLGDEGHQTQIITSRRDLPAIEVAHRMFARWRQENFFKYLREEYALDALVDYGVEPANAERDVPNPERRRLNAELHKAYSELNLLAAEYGAEAFDNLESARRTMRGFKIANAPLGRRLNDALERVAQIEKQRSKVPSRVPVQQLTEGEVIKLRVETKHITDLLKMIAYQAESELLRLLSPHYRRTEDEGRTLIQSVLASAGDIKVVGEQLRVALEPFSSPHRSHAVVALCEHLNQTNTRFPGSNLHLHFEVKPPPETSLAFPGPRSSPAGSPPQPDISDRG